MGMNAVFKDTVAGFTVYREEDWVDTVSTEICNQGWMTHNLGVSTYRNGDSIPNVSDARVWMTLKTGAWCWYDNDSVTYSAKYGKLYNWYAVNDPRGLAPEGWRIPSYMEWVTLDSCIGMDSLGFRIRGQGWPVPPTSADNSSGLNVLPGGLRSDSGMFRMNGDGAVFWVTDPGGESETSCYRVVHYTNRSGIQVMATGWGYTDKSHGYSVRCVRDKTQARH